jgi:hypothetical protein
MTKFYNNALTSNFEESKERHSIEVVEKASKETLKNERGQSKSRNIKIVKKSE